MQIQQQLPADAVGVVVEKLLEVQHVPAQPRRLHGCHDSAHALLSTLAPGSHIGIGADENFFSGIAHAGPQLLERVDIADGTRDGDLAGGDDSRNARYQHVRFSL